jgi:putative NADPH-quinone reductase
MTRALVLLGHADPKSFVAALAHAYVDAFRAAGGTAELVTLSELAFDPVLRHGHARDQALEPALVALRESFERAGHVAWFFPTYWASPPAIVRAVVDRLFLPGWAFRYGKGPLPEGLLRGRSARVVLTMDSPRFWYTLSHNRAVHGAFVSGTLRFVGFRPIRTTTIYEVRTMTENARERRIAEMAALAARDHSTAASAAALVRRPP